MRHIAFILFWLAMILFSCSPKISTKISKDYSALDYREEVRVLGLEDLYPEGYEELGEVKIGDSGFTTNCGWDVVIEKAKAEARKAGGNVLKITDHRPPSAFGSSCHRIEAKILKVDDFAEVKKDAIVDSSLIDADYALLYIYRHKGVGGLINYDLYLSDSVICRVKNNWKETIKIKKDGLNTLWAKTESKDELPVNIKFGNEYYIRCSIKMGAFIGRPKLELIDPKTGRVEFQSIQSEKE